jgi:hypothetical protein
MHKMKYVERSTTAIGNFMFRRREEVGLMEMDSQPERH